MVAAMANGGAAEAQPRIVAPDLAEIRRGFGILCPPGGIVELRALGTPKGTASGYFSTDNLDLLARAAAQCSAVRFQDIKGCMRAGFSAEGVYITINEVLPELFARSAGELRQFVPRDWATKDDQIVRRRWLPIDCDYSRPSGISTTDAEHLAAISVATEIRDHLAALGWGPLVLLDSGNGGHVLAGVDLPNDQASESLVKRILRGLNKKFGRDGVKVDEVNYNAARIWKVPGTVARKGADMPDRPHRVARILA
jgi:hypothetical protein